MDRIRLLESPLHSVLVPGGLKNIWHEADNDLEICQESRQIPYRRLLDHNLREFGWAAGSYFLHTAEREKEDCFESSSVRMVVDGLGSKGVGDQRIVEKTCTTGLSQSRWLAEQQNCALAVSGPKSQVSTTGAGPAQSSSVRLYAERRLSCPSTLLTAVTVTQAYWRSSSKADNPHVAGRGLVSPSIGNLSGARSRCAMSLVDAFMHLPDCSKVKQICSTLSSLMAWLSSVLLKTLDFIKESWGEDDVSPGTRSESQREQVWKRMGCARQAPRAPCMPITLTIQCGNHPATEGRLADCQCRATATDGCLGVLGHCRGCSGGTAVLNKTRPSDAPTPGFLPTPIIAETSLADSSSRSNGRKTIGSETMGRLPSFPEEGSILYGPPIGLVAAQMRLFAGDGNLHKRHLANCTVPPVTGQANGRISSSWAGTGAARKVPGLLPHQSLGNRRVFPHKQFPLLVTGSAPYVPTQLGFLALDPRWWCVLVRWRASDPGNGRMGPGHSNGLEIPEALLQEGSAPFCRAQRLAP
ncbi:hypothetical protein QBC37DRAFT_395553 [Rhypophila decipiens]|uniref:Uncharacterized protein n=1 Tax=Rhypophila decipiens TaxID=261697 RepID=A0AAN6YH98_9PEZI|nr:hypothetical protein QBC37DRAFT_395553 [Rhypophila decipiens]